MQDDSAGELDLTGAEYSSAPVSFFSTFNGSVAKRVLPSSERLNTDGAMALSGERASKDSIPESVGSGESRQAEIRSGSGGQVREEITSAIEALSLGVGIAD